MKREAVHGQATRSVSAHDHLFASVCLMMNAIALSSRFGSDWRSKWPGKQRRRKLPAKNIRHLILTIKDAFEGQKTSEVDEAFGGLIEAEDPQAGIGLG